MRANFFFILVFYFSTFRGHFNKTIIALVLVGYDMIIANVVLHASLAIYHLITKVHSWRLMLNTPCKIRKKLQNSQLAS